MIISTSDNPAHGKELALWAGVLAPAAIWGLHLQVGYAMAPLQCRIGSHWPLLLLTVVAVVLALIGSLLSYRQWRRAGGGSPDDIEGGIIARRRFLGALGVIVALLFAIVIVAQGLTLFFFEPCWN